jgi:thymidine phosphorylase
VAGDVAQGQALARRALDSGTAAERFARMVAALGGPQDVLSAHFAGLARAPVVIDVPAPRAGWLVAMDTREIGLTVVDLGGGRRRASDAIDPAVGLSHVQPCGTRVAAGDPLLRVHARTRSQAEAARERIMRALTLAARRVPVAPVLIERIAGRVNPARARAKPPPRMA